MSVNVSNQETELDKVKKCLTDLSYTDPDALIQHSISLLITFSNFKLQLSTVEKNNIEYQLAQISGPGLHFSTERWYSSIPNTLVVG